MKNLLAQETITNPALGPGLREITGIGFFQKFLPNLLGLSFVIGTLIFFAILIIGAIQWISSGGDKAAIESARGKINNALMGILILFALFALMKFLESFFGINILELNLGPLQIGNSGTNSLE